MSSFLQSVVYIVLEYKKILFIGLTNTFLIWGGSLCLSVGVAFVWGCLRDRRFFHRGICCFFDYLSYGVQGIPFYIQLLIVIFYIAPLAGVDNTFYTGIIALGMCSAAYGSQIIKTACGAVPHDQFILAMNLGYSKKDILFGILVPQAMPHILPLYINESDQLLKSTTILSTVGIFDFTKGCLNIANTTFAIFPVYFILLIVYLSFSLILRYLAYVCKSKLMICRSL